MSYRDAMMQRNIAISEWTKGTDKGMILSILSSSCTNNKEEINDKRLTSR